MAVEVFAPAKVNLALHVTGRRADGYHLLDSLVVFAGVGDRLRATPAAHLALSVTGPEAAGLADGVTRTDNLVLRAARLFDRPPGLRLTLDKHLPVASGIGGGSADAAAALRLVAAMTGQAMPAAEAVLTLGADVPVCLAGRPARIGGIGERIEPCAALPKGAALVLVNPRIPLSTPSVFAALATRENPPLPSLPTRFATFAELSGWLAQGRNDLEAPARGLVPAIGGVLDSLGAAGAPLARMSGSGATCFGLFADLAAAEAAQARIAAAERGWWVVAAEILGAVS
ncbi:MAG: 4-(cytidine 5'-diphospho)-2-C-methyl-D-erythritol kinase [Defluviimonas sp.]|uniref:4-(cytidine 5'-diphospho)-2-C-methyl-D-erythritol kinase n=1 Tax=Albidovulum sp. TaxID=1872424 RepID=UPI001D264DE8|nr:4-(cytidine 5'-diphospho)-2-C-methyl-D-erythritol kinase [Paracoccaceae bacterium]MCC0063202.1 4-(cytidine 5'-diphospho)-2-C-methyl-D-erythritol kinase [Defluviimonas sp.]